MATTSWKAAVMTGALVASIEGVMIGTADPGIDPWHFAQAVSAWFACGVVVSLARSGLPAIWNGIVLTLLLNVPWFIAEAIRAGKPQYLAPLAVASTVLGAIIGLVSARLRRGEGG